MPIKKRDPIQNRGLGVQEAADYFGVSYNTFKKLVARGQAPKPIKIDGLNRTIWYREQLDAWMDKLRDGAAA